MSQKPTLSLIFATFKSEANLPPLLSALDEFALSHADAFDLECVFVVDGSPDRSFEVLRRELPSHAGFRAQLAFAAARLGVRWESAWARAGPSATWRRPSGTRGS